MTDANPKRRRNVLIIQAECKHYRVPLFVSLHRDLVRAGVDLRVVYSPPRPKERARNDSADLPPEVGYAVPGYWFLQERVLFQWCPREIWEADYIIVEHAFKHLLNPPLLLLSLLHLKKVAVWIHGGNLKFPSSPLNFQLRLAHARLAQWRFAYTEKVTEMLVGFGIPRDRCTSLQNSIDVEALRAALGLVDEAKLSAARSQLGLSIDDEVAIYCGSLYRNKGIDFLIDTCDAIKRRRPNFHLLVVGDGAEKGNLLRALPTRPWIHAVGAVLGAEIAVYFRLAQMALKPYLSGLGILDAMTAGLPYIVTKARAVNPEISYLIDGETGIVTEDDPMSFADAVVELFEDGERRHRMSRGSAQESTCYSIANMTQNFSTGIQKWISESSSHQGQLIQNQADTAVSVDEGRARHDESFESIAEVDSFAQQEVAQLVPVRVALLTNILPYYRTVLLEALAKQVRELKIFLSAVNESDRPTQPSWGSLDVTVQHSLHWTHHFTNIAGFRDKSHFHFPVDTVLHLLKFSPDVTISGEFGARTMLAVVYRMLRRRSRLIIWATLSERTEATRSKLRHSLRRRMLSFADAVFVNGKEGERYLRSLDYYGPVFTVPYVVDNAAFAGPRRVPEDGVLHLFFAGQLIERKGMRPFLVQLAAWCKKHPERRIKLTIGGEGPERAALEAVPLPPNLLMMLVGQLSLRQLAEAYRSASLYVFPTLADEWGVVVNEALCAGLPVLGSCFSQAVTELIRDGENGWVFDPTSETAMQNALEAALMTSPRQLAILSRNAVRSIEELTPERIAERMCDAVAIVATPTAVPVRP